MPSTSLAFTSSAEHRAWLAGQARLPAGFRVGTASLAFTPVEVPKPARMNLALIALERPTASFAAKLTRNAFPGAPIAIARRRLAEPRLGAIVVNNKVSNVCAPGGLEAAERVCAEAARALALGASEVLPSSTGVIGWRLPVDAMVDALPRAAAALQSESALPAAEAIMTTDLYPKVRRAEVEGGTIVGIAKGAGMIEPNLATMLVFLLTDLDVPRDELRAALDDVDLAEMAITSAASLVAGEGPPDAFRLSDVPGVAVEPRRAEGKKCARSWKILPNIGADPDYPDVSPRDARALREWEALRKAAE
jgi:glutamate N-acetyltransferase/amino-acid N-acetyltransferase